MHQALCNHLVELLAPEAGRYASVLDFGCGDGHLLGALQPLMPQAALYGIDGGAREIVRAQSVWPGIDFRCERFVDSLPYPDASFDLLITADTLECIPDRQAVLSEFARLLRPGGRILCSHWDWDTQVYASAHKAAIRQLVAAFADWQQPWMEASDGQIGRKLWQIFEGSALFRGQMQSFCLLETEFGPGHYGYNRLTDSAGLVENGRLAASDYESILAEMQALAGKGLYFYSLTSYIYSGNRLAA